MQNAIACNVDAICRMENKEYEAAFDLLCTSLESLTGSAQTSPEKVSQVIQWNLLSIERGVVLGTSNYNSQIDRFFSGSFLFTLPASDSVLRRYTPRQIDYCAAVCLFNMGLACHLEYETCADCAKRNNLLHQACVLYSTAYLHLQTYPVTQDDPVVLLLMALSANLIDVQMELGKVNEVNFWRRTLQDTSATATSTIFAGRPVFVFFTNVYKAPGELNAAKAA